MLTTSVHLLDRVRHPDDQAAWERFVALYSPLLFRWVHRSGLPKAESFDLVQDIFVLLLQELPDFHYEPRRGTFRGWLKTLAVRRAIDWRRRWNPSAPTADSLSALVDGAAVTDVFADDEHRQFLLRRALELMKTDFEPTTWQACWEHTVSGRTAADVGRQLGISESAVYVAKSRVLRRLRAELDGLLD